MHHGIMGAGPNVHFHGVSSAHCMTPGMVAGVVFLTLVGLIAVAGLCWVIAVLV